MALTVTVGGVDRTANVVYESLEIRRTLGEVTDSCRLEFYGFTPSAWQEIVIQDGTTKLFAGYIVSVKRDIVAGTGTIYVAECEDYSLLFRTKLVDEHYLNQTDQAIIQDLISTYLGAEGFTTTSVASSGTIESVSFNNVTLYEAMQKIADLTGYVWYVDPNKDVHYHGESATAAPFGLSDSPDNVTTFGYLEDSWQFEEDASDIRNRITVRGGIRASDPVTESFSGDGTTTMFRLTNRPVRSVVSVEVDGAAQSVGTDFVDSSGYDVYVNYVDGVLRFATAPAAGTSNIEVVYTYDVHVTAQRSDSSSYTKFGRWFDYIVEDKTITSQTKAEALADALLAQYADSRYSGRLVTLEQGLEPGQYVSIVNSVAGVSGSFLITDVVTRMIEGNLAYEIRFGDRSPGIGQVLAGVVSGRAGTGGAGGTGGGGGAGVAYDLPPAAGGVRALSETGYQVVFSAAQANGVEFVEHSTNSVLAYMKAKRFFDTVVLYIQAEPVASPYTGTIYLSTLDSTGATYAQLGVNGSWQVQGNYILNVTSASSSGISLAIGDSGVDSNITLYGQSLAVANDATDVPLTVKGAASQTANLQEWQDSAGTVLAAVDANGRWGVGIGSPVMLAHISKSYTAPTAGLDTTNGVLLITNTAGSAVVQFIGSTVGSLVYKFGDTDNADMGRIQYSNASDAMFFYTAGAERVRIDSAGRVGINTAPTVILEVNSGGLAQNAIFTSAYSTYITVSTTGVDKSPSIRIENDARKWGFVVDGADNDSLKIRDFNLGSDRLTITSAGDIGADTTSPAGKFDLNGDLVLREMTTPSASPADALRLFARDDGTGKTQLCVIWDDGSVTTLATQP
ncbi:MAG: hypothetical protein GXP39_07895 [Chloroflexi bacterium]|nr:hypothetical protein [Chloroflexota bacterium]